MQLLRTVLLLLASVADASLVAHSDADVRRPHKKHESPRQRSASSRHSLRHADGGRMARSVVPADDKDDKWAIREGVLHLQAAEVETDAVEHIAKLEQEDEREEHPAMAQAEAQQRRKLERQASADWSAVAQAASAEAVHLKQQVSLSADPLVAPAAPSGAPAAPADFSWAHKMDAGKPLQEQGFEGKMVQHIDFDTMTDDWHKEHVQSWNTINEICEACSRHPDNSWCRGKCPGWLERLGGQADKATAHAAAATADAASDVTTATQDGGKSLKDHLPDGPEGKLPKGADGLPGGFGDIFKSAASGRMLGLPLLVATLLQHVLQ